MTYRFDDFTLACDTRQLLVRGHEVHVPPKAFELLVFLLANRHRAVSKAELQEHLWPSTFVEETNLARIVLDIRRALGDDAAKPAFVRAIYGFGYRFVGHVTSEPDDAASDPPQVRFWLAYGDRQLPLMSGENVIGRASDVAIQIDAPGVSRRHARVTVSHGEAVLEDLGSKNGTYMNDVRITMPHPLSDGAAIHVGTTSLTFQIAPLTSPTETLAPRDITAPDSSPRQGSRRRRTR